MYGYFQQFLQNEIATIKENGLYKSERIIVSEQGPEIEVAGRNTKVLNFCSNNYLGLSSHPQVIEAAKLSLDSHGYGMSSVRFICGTQDIHRELEKKIAEFCGTDDTILYAACFDANGEYLNHCLPNKMLSFQMNLIMLLLSMECVYVKQKISL